MLWIERLAWVTLPVTVGTAVSDALASWSTGPRVTAAVLLWIAWLGGLLASLVVRPASVAALRTLAPILVVLTVISASSTGVATAALGFGTSLLIVAVVSTSAFARAGLNALSYADEDRYPLKTPPALFLGPLPLAVGLFALGVATGPLLLADGRWVAGAFACVIGAPLALVLARAMLGLTRRMVVLVPAGIVVVDPMTLADACLFTQDHIARLRPVDPREHPDDRTLDTRAGAFRGALALELDEEGEVLRVRPGRRGATMVKVRAIWFASASPGRFEDAARARASRRVA